MLSELLHTITAEAGASLHRIFMLPSSRHFWFFMLCYVLIALVLYLRSSNRQRGAGFFGYLFPKSIYTHPSVLMDIKIWLVIILLVKVGLFALLYNAIYFASTLFDRALDLVWVVETTDETPSLTSRLIYTLVFTCCVDFGFFVMHYLQHKISWLWAFHKVHHSAAVLTPLTANRHHPVDYTIHAASAIVTGSVATVLFTRYHGTEIDSVTLFNTSAIHFFYYMSANLRHSHIWLSFGVGNQLFISPAMHQIHHSTDPRHYDKNFGFVFSLWDWIFGCRYLPVRQEEITVGLVDGETGYRGFFDAMWRPFVDCWKTLKAPRLWRRTQRIQP
jgi:sterol desaturase/sphingolipid hydroxylase (fatty acid hydroxylase superfamily)